MSWYKEYISVVLIILMFFALAYLRNDMVQYDTMTEHITKNYGYSQNGESYEYTFLEFDSTGCYTCRQMEDVMEEIKSQYESKVKVIFANH